MSSSAEGDESRRGPAPARRPRWWVPVGLFVAGVLVGVLAVGLLNATTPEFLTSPPGGEPAPGSGPSGSGTVPVTAQARVNAACLRVINEAQDVSSILSDVDEAVTDVDLQQLDDIVRQLQPLEPRLRRDLLDCRVDTGIDTGGGPGGTPAPAPPSPTPSATR